MKPDTNISRRTVLQTIPATAVGVGVVTETAGAARGDSRSVTSCDANEVGIVAEHDHEADEHAFELSTSEVGAGWTTLTFDNRTDHTHIAYVAKLPQDAIAAAESEGADLLDYYVEHVTQPFQWFMDDLDPAKEPNPDDLSDKYSNPDEGVIFPGWFENVLPSGGAGFTSGCVTSKTTVDLDPGEYVVECYVKNDDGEFHSYIGMIEQFTVTEDQPGPSPRRSSTSRSRPMVSTSQRP